MFLIRRKHLKIHIFRLKRHQIRLSFWQLLGGAEMQESLGTGDFAELGASSGACAHTRGAAARSQGASPHPAGAAWAQQ